MFTISQVNIDGKDLWEPCKQGDEDAQQMTFEKDVSKHVDIAPIQMTKEEIFEIAKKIRDHSYITSALVGGEGGQKMPIFAYS